ncbi:PEP-CTERM sorting domain-containing protein [Paucibacter sp. B2R-40]|uniref:PEP-CTERM sorting domain-containing protein n=1 Tax=Paucibacter sp. B2R-40 TaxID=2893554 RepID=UPI0021E4A812|nr:PEP-CTERM sorting domain-containing protein [Paucibacter sp. B2R-40]MCV2352996.1 PEP-CTERM sorting domain-containing protein [Paucibacter sp. B2R-40]
MKLSSSSLALAAGLTLLNAGSAAADTTIITFEDLVEGTLLSTQYSALGVNFVANAFSGSGSSSSGKPWASNTDMTVTATDVAGLGGPSLVSGNVLHSFSGWQSEDGDPSFWINFSAAVSSVSMDFAGIGSPSADTRLFVYNGASLLGSVTAIGGTGQQTLSFSAASITKVGVAAGNFRDWVAVDNLKFEAAAPVPEPASYALMVLGLAGLLAKRRGCAR